MAEYKTPGVYVEESSQSTPTAAQVPTAIPAFIGYTEKANKRGANLTNEPTYVSSLLEFRDIFGGGYTPTEITVKLDEQKSIANVSFGKKFYMFDSIRMFFANGGSQCCIISVGNYSDEIEKERLSDGLELCKREDLPTMIVIPEAVLLPSKDDCYAVQKEALMLSEKLKDRISILDIYEGFKEFGGKNDCVTDFRVGIGITALQYGAAYYPWLQTTFTTNFSFKNVTFKDVKGKDVALENLVSNSAIINNLKTAIADHTAIRSFISSPFGDNLTIKDKFNKVDNKSLNTKAELNHKISKLKAAAEKLIELRDGLSNNIVKNEVKLKTNPNSIFTTILKSLYSIDLALQTGNFDLTKDFLEIDLSKVAANEDVASITDENEIVKFVNPLLGGLLDNFMKLQGSIRTDAGAIEDQLDKNVFDNVPLYQSAVSEIYKELAKLPPSGAIAGIYSQVDNARGIWKAPANVSLANTVKPWVKIDNDQQESLNVDSIGGKSINAIRSFPGQGNLVWGARTLAGNDNDWRYISVRRLFSMVEKTLKQSTAWAVFEPNVEMTWIRLKAMMNNYLTNLWKAGALVGSTPDEAFSVNVGLGTTMTQVDILEGRLNIEVGMSVVRPAEFIVLKFSHKYESAGGEEGGDAPAE